MNRFSFAVVAILAAILSGCTLSYISEVRETLPPETRTVILCEDYSDYFEMTSGMRMKEQQGWMPRVVGYKHYIVLGILAAKLNVCYERSKNPEQVAPAAAPQPAAVEEQPAVSEQPAAPAAAVEEPASTYDEPLSQ